MQIVPHFFEVCIFGRQLCSHFVPCGLECFEDLGRPLFDGHTLVLNVVDHGGEVCGFTFCVVGRQVCQASHFDLVLRHLIEVFPTIAVDHQLIDGRGLVPTGEVVELRDVVEAKTCVDDGHGEFGRIDRATLQRGEDITTSQKRCGHAKTLHDFCTKAEEAHVQTFKVGDRVDLILEPAGCLGCSHTTGQNVDVKASFNVHTLEQFQTVVVQHPAKEFASFWAEWHSGEQRCCGDFTLPVTSSGVGRVYGTGRHSVEGFQSGDQLTGIEVLEFHFSGDRIDLGDKVGGASAEDWQVLTERCGHLEHFLGLCCGACNGKRGHSAQRD